MGQIEHDYVDNNGIRLHYAHSGQGPLILFVHGFPECWVQWKSAMEALSDEYRVVAMDMRGYNLSDRPADIAAYGREALLSDLNAVVDHFGVQKFTLVAHDWGGMMAWYYAGAFPERLNQLVILNAAHPLKFRDLYRGDARQQASSGYIKTLISPESPSILAANDFAYLRKIFAPLVDKKLIDEGEMEAYVAAWKQPGALLAMTHYYRADINEIRGANPAHGPHPWEGENGPKRIDVPTLILWGEKDPYFIDENLHGLDQYLSNLKVVKLGVGHWVAQEAGREVVAQIRACSPK